MSVGSSEDRGCGSVVEHLLQMKKALGTIPKSSEDTKYSRKTTISVVFIILDPEDLKGLGFKDLAEGNLFSLGLIEGFLPATLPNNLAIYKENRDSQSWQWQVAPGSNGTLLSTKLGQNSPAGRAHLWLAEPPLF
jgi:hypothetical protein